MSQSYDVCVIGAGPGGYVAAIRSAQLGLKTALVEKQYLGGVCLNVGCIPSKAMITASHFYHRLQHDAKKMGIHVDGSIRLDMSELVQWKQSVCDKMSGGVKQLLKGNGVDVFMDEAKFINENTVQLKNADETLNAQNFIISTGSKSIDIPGFEVDEQTILSSTGALNLSEVPSQVVVIGGGYIGLEIGTYLSKLGSQVTVVEALSEILSEVVDPDCAQVVSRKLKKNKVKVLLSAKAKGLERKNGRVFVSVEVKGKTETLEADKILITVGRKPYLEGLELDVLGIQLDSKGFIQVNEKRQTNKDHVYAIGDVAGQPMLAHKASHEGILVSEIIAGKPRVYDVKTVPAIIFTDPEIASVGLTENECKNQGYQELKISKFPFAANGRAVSLMETDGFVKIIADAKNNVILGVHIVGPEASNLISEAALALEMGATLDDLALTIHPHPTLGETIMESAEMALGHAIHVIQKK